MRVAALVLTIAVLPVVASCGQLNASALEGVTVVDAQIYVTWDDLITSTISADFELAAKKAFFLGLVRAGVKIEDTAPNYLACFINLLDVGSAVAIAYRVEYQEMVGEPIHWAITWRRAWVGAVGESRLDGESAGQTCVEAFEADWLRANE